MVELEVLLFGGQFCFNCGPDALRCKWGSSHFHNGGADIQTNVCATREAEMAGDKAQMNWPFALSGNTSFFSLQTK